MSGQSKKLLGLVLVLFGVVYLASCAVPPPTQELADAEAAVQEAKDCLLYTSPSPRDA